MGIFMGYVSFREGIQKDHPNTKTNDQLFAPSGFGGDGDF